TMESGGPTHTHMSPTLAAGSAPMSTVGAPGPVTGPPTCGMGAGTAGVCIGHWCMSVNLAAGGILFRLAVFLRRQAWNGQTIYGLSLNLKTFCTPKKRPEPFTRKAHAQLIITMAPWIFTCPDAVSSAAALPCAENFMLAVCAMFSPDALK